MSKIPGYLEVQPVESPLILSELKEINIENLIQTCPNTAHSATIEVRSCLKS